MIECVFEEWATDPLLQISVFSVRRTRIYLLEHIIRTRISTVSVPNFIADFFLAFSSSFMNSKSHLKLNVTFLIISDLLCHFVFTAHLCWQYHTQSSRKEKYEQILNKKFKLAKQIFSMSFHNRMALIILPLHPECFEFDLISIYIWARIHSIDGPTFWIQITEWVSWMREHCSLWARVCLGREKDEQKWIANMDLLLSCCRCHCFFCSSFCFQFANIITKVSSETMRKTLYWILFMKEMECRRKNSDFFHTRMWSVYACMRVCILNKIRIE